MLAKRNLYDQSLAFRYTKAEHEVKGLGIPFPTRKKENQTFHRPGVRIGNHVCRRQLSRQAQPLPLAEDKFVLGLEVLMVRAC